MIKALCSCLKSPWVGAGIKTRRLGQVLVQQNGSCARFSSCMMEFHLHGSHIHSHGRARMLWQGSNPVLGSTLDSSLELQLLFYAPYFFSSYMFKKLTCQCIKKLVQYIRACSMDFRAIHCCCLVLDQLFLLESTFLETLLLRMKPTKGTKIFKGSKLAFGKFYKWVFVFGQHLVNFISGSFCFSVLFKVYKDINVVN